MRVSVVLRAQLEVLTAPRLAARPFLVEVFGGHRLPLPVRQAPVKCLVEHRCCFAHLLARADGDANQPVATGIVRAVAHQHSAAVIEPNKFRMLSADLHENEIRMTWPAANVCGIESSFEFARAQRAPPRRTNRYRPRLQALPAGKRGRANSRCTAKARAEPTASIRQDLRASPSRSPPAHRPLKRCGDNQIRKVPIRSTTVSP